MFLLYPELQSVLRYDRLGVKSAYVPSHLVFQTPYQELKHFPLGGGFRTLGNN